MTTTAENTKSNAINSNLANKNISDTQCDLKVAVDWVVSAQNALANNSGFSPDQLLFGFNSIFQLSSIVIDPH